MDRGPHKSNKVEVVFYKQAKTGLGLVVDKFNVVDYLSSPLFLNQVFPGDKLLAIYGADGRYYTIEYLLQKQPSWLFFTFGWKKLLLMRKTFPKIEDPVRFMRKR